MANELILVSDLPCSNCKAECCILVPVSEHEINDIIIPYLQQHPGDIMRLAGQSREQGCCPFVDKENNYECAVYDVRPKVCRYYGRVNYPSLTCPYKPEMAVLDKGAALVDLSCELEMWKYQGKGRGALLGVTITWNSLLGR